MKHMKYIIPDYIIIIGWYFIPLGGGFNPSETYYSSQIASFPQFSWWTLKNIGIHLIVTQPTELYTQMGPWCPPKTQGEITNPLPTHGPHRFVFFYQILGVTPQKTNMSPKKGPFQ